MLIAVLALLCCLQEEMAVLEARLFELAGRPLNLASRQQLSQVMFQELQVKPRDRKYKPPKTKAGIASTKEVRCAARRHSVELEHKAVLPANRAAPDTCVCMATEGHQL
jgi:DNA polymerase I-like protein with 3'-5' exonuclease and polymerase domains